VRQFLSSSFGRKIPVTSVWCSSVVNRWVANDYLLLVVQFAGLNKSLTKMLQGLLFVLNVPVFCFQSVHRIIIFKMFTINFSKITIWDKISV
jgi:hypothetical protein